MSKRRLESCDIAFVDIGHWILTERVKREIDLKQETFRRWTKAVANLISTDDIIKERLINAIMENDRRRNGYE